MKKRLEADLISIAHRILQLKNKSDVNQLFLETQKLYEKLSVLRFVEEQYGEAKPTIGHAAIVNDVETFYDNEGETVTKIATLISENRIEEISSEAVLDVLAAVNEVPTETIKEVIGFDDNKSEKAEEVAKTIIDKPEVKEIEIEEEIIDKLETETPPAFAPHFTLSEEEEEIAPVVTPKKAEAIQISFEDLLGGNYSEPQFVKVDQIEAITPTPVFEPVETVAAVSPKSIIKPEKATDKSGSKVVSVNDKFSKGIDIDLNDQIAFVKHLFGNSREDYNRVLSQIITFDNFYETKTFIDEMVKPDYNEWKGKDDYEERFMDIIEKKFL